MTPPLASTEQRRKALRIYAAALPLIAEAVGMTPKVLHNVVLRRVLFKDLEALQSEPDSKEGQKIDGGGSGDSVPVDTHRKSWGTHGLVTLCRHGLWLNHDGSGTTLDRTLAYRDTLPAAKKMRETSAHAKGMSITHFI